MACYCASRQLGHPSRLGCGRGWPHDRQPGACCGPGCGRQRAPCPRSGRHAGSRRAQPPRDSLRLNRGGAASVQVFLVSSADGGRSWSERRNLTVALKANPAPEAFVMPGPPGGVQLQSGRLVVGMYGEDEAKQVQATDYSPLMPRDSSESRSDLGCIAGPLVRGLLRRPRQDVGARVSGGHVAERAGLRRRREPDRAVRRRRHARHVPARAHDGG